MRNRPDSEPIDVVDLTIHALAGSMKIEHTHFERSLTRYKTRTLRVEIAVLITGLAFTI
jgi:hypothetical protein